jgi:hypothetical protein
MPLTALKWRKLAPVNLAANTVNAALDALYTAGTAATYADGSPRTPGTDSAWTWSRDTTNALQPGANTASYAFPPTAGYAPLPGTVVPQAMLWCGTTTVGGPTATLRYAFPAAQIDARAAGMLYVGQCKNPGAYSDWNSATPFTSGQFTGCANALVAFATATWNAVYMWESQEAILVTFARTSPQINTSWSGGGAVLDPNSVKNSETDGRLYGVFANGLNNYCPSTMWATTSDMPFYENSTAGNARFGIFSPGTATINGYTRLGVTNPTSTFVTRSVPPEIPLVPVYANGIPAPARLREIWLARDAVTTQSFTNGGVALGYIAGSFFTTTAADVAILTV